MIYENQNHKCFVKHLLEHLLRLGYKLVFNTIINFYIKLIQNRMKNNVYFFCLILLIVSCNNTKKEENKTLNTKENTYIQIEKKEESRTGTSKTPLKSSSIDKESEEIVSIKKWFSEINSSISNYKKKENKDIDIYKDSNPEKYSYESERIYRLAMVDLERYYESNELRKAIVRFYGYQEDLISEYYFWNDSLFFVFKTEINYLKSKSADDFTESDKKKMESRFYFQNGKLIRWLDHNKKQMNLTDVKAKKIEQEILSDSRLYRNIK